MGNLIVADLIPSECQFPLLFPLNLKGHSCEFAFLVSFKNMVISPSKGKHYMKSE